MQAPVPVIYDTDLGEDIDDLYALYLALFHPAIDLLAVTTVHGDTQAKARLARKVLRLAGFPRIPVGAGIEMSDARTARGQKNPDPADAASYIKYVLPDDQEWGVAFPPAAEVITQALARATEPLAFIVEGAFSNVAAAIRSVGPEVEKVRCVAAMGGETQRVMNEYNVLCDPEAADSVLNSGVPVFLGTYDLTAQLRMTMQEVEDAFAGSQNPLHQVLLDCTELWWEKVRGGRKSGPVLYDLVPVFWLANSLLIETLATSVRVELDGRYTRGQTVRVCEERKSVLESECLDQDALMTEFMHVMCNAQPGQETALSNAR